MTERAHPTSGIFTTQKLQALLDCRLNPEAVSRVTLSKAMTAAGEKISVHGIDAWFRPQDSNYGIERTSLEPGRRTYAVPKRRWAILLALFSLEEADLDQSDTEFRRWCFARKRAAARARSASVPAAEVLLLSHAAAAVPASVVAALERGGGTVQCVDVSATDADALLARRLRSAKVVLVWPWRKAAEHALVLAGLRRARELGLPGVWVRTGDDAAPRPSLEGIEEFDAATLANDLQALLTSASVSNPAQGGAEADWFAPAPITDRPSIAVLPFVNLTGDDSGDELAASLTGDVTTLLARIPEFFVIAHSTMRGFRERHPDHDTLRRQLGVRYLLEGSVRSDGVAMRVAAELIDAGNGRSLWSQRFDRPLAEVFSVQDELTAALCAQLEPQVRVADIVHGADTANVTSWRLWQEGWHWIFVDAPQPAPERSIERFRKAIELDPDYGLAHAGLAVALATGLLWGGISREALREARHHAEIAYKRLPENPVALYAMAMITFSEPGGLEIPLDYARRAAELEPSNPMYQAVTGYLLANLGQTAEGVEKCRLALRLSPRDSREPFLCYMLGAASIANAQYEYAIETMMRCRRFSEVDFIWLMIAFAHAQLGETDRALQSLRRIQHPRPYRFYRWAVLESLWLGLPRQDKDDFLKLMPLVGIE
ncbi:MAG TPA: hypothetical protein VLA56_08935 [Pseudomonadales bacterium]|nr:hypothetical protein [Pseudomonadales bacterium]